MDGRWSGLPFPSPGDLPNPGMEASSPPLLMGPSPPSHQGAVPRIGGRCTQCGARISLDPTLLGPEAEVLVSLVWLPHSLDCLPASWAVPSVRCSQRDLAGSLPAGCRSVRSSGLTCRGPGSSPRILAHSLHALLTPPQLPEAPAPSYLSNLIFHFISGTWRFYCLSLNPGSEFLSHCSFLCRISIHS